MSWTPDRIALAKKLYVDQGLSAAAAARQIGGVTRNAVIGIAHRQGWSRSPEAARQNIAPNMPRRAPRPPRPAPVPEPRPQSMRAAGAATPPRPFLTATCQLLDLPLRHCKWPIGDPLSETFGFCGRPADGEAAYCADHRRVGTQPAKKSVATANGLARSLRRYL